MKWRNWVLAGCLLAPLAASADDSRDGGGRAASGTAAGTVYVIDKLQVGLRAERDGAAVKSLETGAALEVLQRDERFVRVRDRAGAEGWVEARYLSPELPARAQLAKLQEELNKARTQLAAGQAKSNDPAPVPVIAADAETEYELDYIWFFVALGTLVAGFIAGILWHRESLRRRMGGMYLRI